MRKIPLHVIFFLLFLLQATSQELVYDQEQSILLKLKQFWDSPPSTNDWTLSNSTSHCSWPEITCVNNSVTGILLSNVNITGTIPPFICDLKNITTIDLSLNYIPGIFPTVLYNCSKLEYLDLSQNYFVGPIPNDVYSLVNLWYLNLAANNFSGDIPASIGSLRMLESLHLYQNQFNGTFPPEIGDLGNLQVLEMAYNLKFLPQMLPESFTQLKNLKVLWFSNANLIGEIPEGIGNMTALENLDLSANNLSGKIPDNLFKLKNLTAVYLYKNNLTGEIPQIIECFNMNVIDFSQNNLIGTIPDDFGKLENLTGLALFSNQLSGEIPYNISQIQTLINLKLFSNNLTGTIPPDFGRYSKLKSFELSSNNLTGTLPEYLCAGGDLAGVVVFDNKLTGKLPDSFNTCTNLLVVMIDNNNFSGQFPAGLWSLPNLETLIISNNSFTGELPDTLGQNLSRIEMSSNNFSGQIPNRIDSWKNLQVLIASNNQFFGTIPSNLTALSSLTTLLLDKNQLSGHLPLEIVSWNSLNTLNLSRNQLSGQIPSQIGSLPVLIDLDLSENQLTGNIPPELGHLRLTTFNLSSNLLSGEIPTAFDNAVFANSFLNNTGLCTIDNSNHLGLRICNSKSPKSNRKISTRFLAILISILVVSILVSALLLAIYLMKLREKKKHDFNSTWKLTSFQRLNFTETNILSSLTENNLIGSGGSGKVYRVVLTRSGSLVAVKKISNSKKLDHSLEKQFLSEVEILSTIRHSNIVKLLCCVSSDNSKLLVYEYMKNQSLDKWIHNNDGVVLDWPKRMHIATGAAQGLCYMHHDCSPAIVHRDVKSSNILLDSEFNAKIADFGLAKILIDRGDINTMSVVAGSLGYIAPESAYTTRVDEKIDVYSFGVVLLELVTGKEAHEGGEDEPTSLAEWAWRHVKDNKRVEDALANDIKDPSYIDEMCNVFKLGVICTATSPSSRPTMKEVLQFLLRYNNRVTVYGEKNEKIEYDGAPLLKNSKRERTLDNDEGNLVS